MPSQGMKITNSTQRVLATPPRSLLQKISPKIQNRHMNQAKNRKISKSASRKGPFSLNIDQPFGGAKTDIHRCGDSRLGTARRHRQLRHHKHRESNSYYEVPFKRAF